MNLNTAECSLPYAVTWDGRTSGGTRLPAGTYKIKASFKDTLGHTMALYAVWK